MVSVEQCRRINIKAKPLRWYGIVLFLDIPISNHDHHDHYFRLEQLYKYIQSKKKTFIYLPFPIPSFKHGLQHTGAPQFRPDVAEASGDGHARLSIHSHDALCETSVQSVEKDSNKIEIEAVSEEHEDEEEDEEEEEPRQRRNGRGVGRRGSMAEGDLDGG